MAAAHKDPLVRSLPVQSGMLRVSGETIEGPRPSDLFDVFVDDEGDLVIVLVDVQGVAESSGSLLGAMMRHARSVLERHAALHQVVAELEMRLAVRPGTEVGLIIVRVSERDARVELLNAGMPPLAHALPGGHLSLHPPLSGPIGHRIGEVHPYELVPLIWGGAWLAVSDGMTGGSHDGQIVREISLKLELEQKGMTLSAATGEKLYELLQAVLPQMRFLRDDATCIILGADALGQGGRFQSGITHSR